MRGAKMEEVGLTLTDRQVLSSYVELIPGLAEYLGSSYEIVLHSLDSYEHSVIAIVNGEHTGRRVGAPITDRALEMLERSSATGLSSETYFSTNRNGEPLKSTTIAIRGEGDRIIGLLCMNFYMNTPLNDILIGMIPNANDIIAPLQSDETFASSTDDMIASTLENVRAQVYRNSEIPSSAKNKAIVRFLRDKGIFRIKDSVPKVAELLGISKNTVYFHLRNIEE